MARIFIFLFTVLIQLPALAGVPMVFTGENLLSGDKVTIPSHDSTKKGTVVIFMSAKCPCSNGHVSEIKKLSEIYKDFKFLVIHSNADEPKAQAKAYFKDAQFSFIVIEDTQAKIADQLKANKTPHVFLLNPEGEIVYQGGATNSVNAAVADKHYLSDALEDLSQGKKVRMAQGRTLGCIIMRENEKNVW